MYQPYVLQKTLIDENTHCFRQGRDLELFQTSMGLSLEKANTYDVKIGSKESSIESCLVHTRLILAKGLSNGLPSSCRTGRHITHQHRRRW